MGVSVIIVIVTVLQKLNEHFKTNFHHANEGNDTFLDLMGKDLNCSLTLRHVNRKYSRNIRKF